MKHIHNFESFINEAAGPVVAPEVAMRMNAQASMAKIADLKKEMMDKPEQRDFIEAKIKVEMEKLDMIVAKKNLLTAKEREELRKTRDKARAAAEKEKAAVRKELEKKFD